jgi:Arc/MetJ-type ribon-helix-helix transcriptional regulator
MSNDERVIVRLNQELASAFDAYVAQRGYSSRSAAISDLIRAFMDPDDGGGGAQLHGASRPSSVRRRRAHALVEQPGAHDAVRFGEDAERVPQVSKFVSTEAMLLAQFGPTLTYADLAKLLKRREGGLRQTLYVCRAPWCQRLIAARFRIGRRSVFKTPLVAAFLDDFDTNDL